MATGSNAPHPAGDPSAPVTMPGLPVPDVPVPDALLERPLTARSLIASLLLGRHPPSASAGVLVRWCALFGVAESAARVALTRMTRVGELVSRDATYELTGRMRERQAEQDFAVAPHVEEWSGRWLLAVARSTTRTARERSDLRRSMEHRRMRPLRDGVWTRPDNLPGTAHDPEVLDHCLVLDAVPGARDLGELVALWELDGYEARSAMLLDRLRRVTAQLPDETWLAEAFVVGAAAAQHLRRDPLLPAQLVPRTWSAPDLRSAYVVYVGELDSAVASWSASR